jgi:hypothetical protein
VACRRKGTVAEAFSYFPNSFYTHLGE